MFKMYVARTYFTITSINILSTIPYICYMYGKYVKQVMLPGI